MNVTSQITLVLDPSEYSQLVLLIDYIVNDDANMTPEMYAFAVSSATKFGLKIEAPAEEEPEQKLH